MQVLEGLDPQQNRIDGRQCILSFHTEHREGQALESILVDRVGFGCMDQHISTHTEDANEDHEIEQVEHHPFTADEAMESGQRQLADVERKVQRHTYHDQQLQSQLRLTTGSIESIELEAHIIRQTAHPPRSRQLERHPANEMQVDCGIVGHHVDEQ